jgi:hypothetical protein
MSSTIIEDGQRSAVARGDTSECYGSEQCRWMEGQQFNRS